MPIVVFQNASIIYLIFHTILQSVVFSTAVTNSCFRPYFFWFCVPTSCCSHHLCSNSFLHPTSQHILTLLCISSSLHVILFLPLLHTLPFLSTSHPRLIFGIVFLQFSTFLSHEKPSPVTSFRSRLNQI